MKRSVTQLPLCAWLLLGSGSLFCQAEDAAKKEEKPAAPATVLYKTDGPIEIDGKLDEPAWKSATAVDVDLIWNKVGTKAKEPKSTVRFTWDDNYLYVGYETFDKNLIALAAEREEGPKENRRKGAEIWHEKLKVDVVEFFVSFGDPHFFWELHHNAGNQFNDVWITNLDDNWPIAKSSLAPFGILFGFDEAVKDDAEAGVSLKFAALPKPKADGKPSTVNDDSDTDTGYFGELRFPWAALGVPREREVWLVVEPKEPEGQKTRKHGPWKIEGLEMMLLTVFQDGDLEDRYHHSSPTFKGGWFAKGVLEWPHYVFKTKPE